MNDFTHGGHVRALAQKAGCEPEELIDFSASINPLGPPAWFRAEVASTLSGLVHYPDPHCEALVGECAKKYAVDAAEVVAGNGSTEILYALVTSLGIERAVVPVPSYTDYRRACEMSGAEVVPVVLREEDSFAVDFDAIEACLTEDEGRTAVFVGQPNNPTGKTVDAGSLRALATRWPEVLFVVDEAFADFLPDLDRLASRRPANMVVLYSLTKFFAVPGLRLGLAFAEKGLAARIRKLLPPWSVNAIAQAVGARALRDVEYAERTISETVRLRTALAEELGALPGVTVLSGEVNFLLCKLGAGAPAASELAGKVLKHRIAIRVCDSFEGLQDRYFRVAVKNDEQNAALVAAMRSVLAPSKPLKRAKRTPAIMLQGTASNAGKSVLAAALCRILLQDGVDVAPFKSQNMALNSFVTLDGGEMGRAQVTQAAACRMAPDVRMNPVLLKPSTDTGSQVIVMGQPVGHMRVAEYIKYKEAAFAEAKKAYDSIASEHQVMVIEGAGSPAEINLKRHDIVNMNMARYAGAKVLLAGDIDRGGVFASFVGTMEMLEEWERDLTAGFIINRFRGDASLLKDALDYTTARTGKPFYGVVPYLANLGLPEEDSVSFKSGALDMKPSSERVIDIAVIDLPHISNFTDIDPLMGEPDVLVRIVRRPEDLGAPHAVVIPGSKNVVADMRWVRDNGMGDALRALLASDKTQCVGICGGLQILGKTIADPLGVEGGGVLDGLGLLAVSTELAPQKTLVRADATHGPSGEDLYGYEIHHGVTKSIGGGAHPVVIRADGEAIGWANDEGLVWGSYLHGLFDADSFRRAFVDGLREQCGFEPLGKIVAPYDLEPALDRLAQTVRDNIDMEALYKALGL